MGEDFLSPRSDLIFKLLFGNEHGVEQLTDFLKAVLRLPADDYDEVIFVDPHMLPGFEGDKLGILDVKLKTRSKKTIDIEIQLKPALEFKERMIFYSAKMITEQLGAGEDYTQIKRAISIIITDYPLISDSKEYHNRYTLNDADTHSEFTDIIEIDTLELTKLPESGDETQLWDWMKFLSARSEEDLNMIAQRNPQVKKAVARLMELSKDEQTRLLYESRQKMEWDNISREKDARAEGLREGRKEGRKEGQKEGWTEGRKRERIIIAKKLLSRNRPIDEIMEDTGLSRDEIETLRKNV